MKPNAYPSFITALLSFGTHASLIVPNSGIRTRKLVAHIAITADLTETSSRTASTARVNANATGGIAGYYLGRDYSAFVLIKGKLHDLGNLGLNYSVAYAINALGHACGSSLVKGGRYGHEHAFLWTGGKMVDLGTLGGDYSSARGINRSDQVVGYAYPASWFQSVNSLFIIALAPVFAWLWVWLGPKEPSSPAKFSWGLIFVGLGFVVMVVASRRAQSGVQVSSLWLWLVYLLHTIGELCLSPVGLSAFTKLAPARVAGLMMGVWFLSTSIGDYIGGRMASFYTSWPLPVLFSAVAAYCIVLGLALALFVKPMKKLMGGVN